MDILTYIVIGEEDEAQAIAESSNPIEEWSGIEARGIDTAKIATLHCLLTGDTFEDATQAYEPVYTVEEGAVVLRIPDDVVEKFASLDEEALDRVAEELSGTEEFELAQWGGDEVQALVVDLAELAQRAEFDVQAMYVWMHPLPT